MTCTRWRVRFFTPGPTCERRWGLTDDRRFLFSFWAGTARLRTENEPGILCWFKLFRISTPKWFPTSHCPHLTGVPFSRDPLNFMPTTTAVLSKSLGDRDAYTQGFQVITFQPKSNDRISGSEQNLYLFGQTFTDMIMSPLKQTKLLWTMHVESEVSLAAFRFWKFPRVVVTMAQEEWRLPARGTWPGDGCMCLADFLFVFDTFWLFSFRSLLQLQASSFLFCPAERTIGLDSENKSEPWWVYLNNRSLTTKESVPAALGTRNVSQES